jgi:hypothetical protein
MSEDELKLYRAMESSSPVKDIGAAISEPNFVKFRASPALNTRNMQELLGQIGDFMRLIGLPATVSMEDLNAYFQAMSHNPAFGLPSTTAGNGTLWLFIIVRALKPALIVESGVHHGSSLFTLKAAAPQAKMFAFDITFAKLLARHESIDYRQYDWGKENIRAEAPSDICFFDDHINNCMRIRQSYDRGFRHVIVDDSPDIGELQHFRFPAVPSVSMIEKGKWVEGDTVEWNWSGRRLRYTFREAETFGAKEVIEASYRLPNLKRWTGLDDSVHYYVRLKAQS